MVMQHPHQADDIGAKRERIRGEIPAHRHGAIRQPFPGEALPTLFRHSRQVE